ncbi:MAG: UDP-glucose 4-epimerase GalE [Bacilli bacterium]|nr:UDP-glucose 4-epimerase GalE [Bacilli bacterium]
MKILVTGGAGYIGSHTCVELLNSGYEVVIVDNFSNSKPDVIDKIKKITNKDIIFYEGNVSDYSLMNKIFEENTIEAVIHFAGYKAVGESVKKPLMYYHNNLESTITLLEVMQEHDCKKMVFSSSATVYGEQETPKYVETMERRKQSNPYGRTKTMIEQILEDVYAADNSWNITLLRYFNPVGSHESGLLGDDPNGIPNNLMPYIIRVSMQELPCLTIFGNDYETPDGTCIRDYIHVVDLAKGHLKALDHAKGNDANLYIYNLGSGKGVSVQEMVDTFEKTNDLKLNYVYGDRRAGDLPEYYADATKALKELNWKTEKTLEDMCRDSYNFAINSKSEK